MNTKTLIALAVASAYALPGVAAAAGDEHGTGHWAVVTPASPNESGPSFEQEAEVRRSGAGRLVLAAGTPAAQPMVPSSVDESAPWMTAYREPRPALAPIAMVSLANPDTPFSASESGPVRYTDEVRARAEHVAQVETVRAAVRAENERLAAAPAAAVDAAPGERLAAAEPLERPDGMRAPAETAGLIDSRQAAGGIALTPETAPAQPERERAPEHTAGLLDSRQSLGSAAPVTDALAGGSEPLGTRAGDAAEHREPTLPGAVTLDAPATAAAGAPLPATDPVQPGDPRAGTPISEPVPASTAAGGAADERAPLADAALPEGQHADRMGLSPGSGPAPADAPGMTLSGTTGSVATDAPATVAAAPATSEPAAPAVQTAPPAQPPEGATPGTGLTRSEGPQTGAPVVAPRADKPGTLDDASVVRRDPDAAGFARDAAAGPAPTPAEAPGVGAAGHIPGYADVTVHSTPEGTATAH